MSCDDNNHQEQSQFNTINQLILNFYLTSFILFERFEFQL